MRKSRNEICVERMNILIENAILNGRKNPKLAQQQAQLARKLSMRQKIRMPYQLRMNFCKECKNFLVPGLTSKIRLGGSSIKAIRITCYYCGHTYRKIIPQ